jgi:hypothetical protein
MNSTLVSRAGFVVISIPTLIVFLTRQRIILRGIIIPQMKQRGSRGERAPGLRWIE